MPANPNIEPRPPNPANSTSDAENLRCAHGVPLAARIAGPSNYCQECSDAGVPYVAITNNLSAWRADRGPRWYDDIGYALQDVIQKHRYEIREKGSKPNDPGWHVCSCGEWEGYWSDFQPHVADHLRGLVVTIQMPVQTRSKGD